MAQHITRKELKKDEVRDTLVHAGEAVLSHQQLVTYVVAAAAIVALAIFGWKYYTEKQTEKASAGFSEAMKIFQARIRAAGETPNPNEVTYLADSSKYEDALKKFNDVANAYPHTRPGQLARYYAALSLEHLNRNDQAQKLLQGLERSSTADFAAMARFELAQLDEKTGKGDEAVKLYQQLIAHPAVLVPKPVVMLALADHYLKTNPAEASKLYNQIKLEYPDTPASQQADQQLQLLPGRT